MYLPGGKTMNPLSILWTNCSLVKLPAADGLVGTIKTQTILAKLKTTGLHSADVSGENSQIIAILNQIRATNAYKRIIALDSVFPVKAN